MSTSADAAYDANVDDATTRRRRHASRPRKKRAESLMAWGGFCDGKLNIYGSDDGAAVFKSRRAARAQYCDVRRIEIREV